MLYNKRVQLWRFLSRTVNYSEARQNLADVLESAVTGVPVTITRRGHKSAVIISAEEFERYQAARMDDEFAAIMAVHGDEIRELADK
ncbi:type II toxin-antitoxin system Phd/YefM family antitoxin [Klebsiella pneumoniae]